MRMPRLADHVRALGDAEATVAALDEVFVPLVEPPARLGLRISASSDVAVSSIRHMSHDAALRRRTSRLGTGFFAAAAALLLFAGISAGALFQRSATKRQVAQDSSVLATIATSHFKHASFTARETAAPIAKVLYARDGRWFYVIVDSATCNCRLVARSATAQRDLGSLDVHGSTATRFVTDFPRPTSLELVHGLRSDLASVSLVYRSPHVDTEGSDGKTLILAKIAHQAKRFSATCMPGDYARCRIFSLGPNSW